MSISELVRENAALNGHNDALRIQLSENTRATRVAEAKLEELSEERAAWEKERQQLLGQVKRLEKRNAKLETDNTTLQDEKTELKCMMSDVEFVMVEKIKHLEQELEESTAEIEQKDVEIECYKATITTQASMIQEFHAERNARGSQARDLAEQAEEVERRNQFLLDEITALREFQLQRDESDYARRQDELDTLADQERLDRVYPRIHPIRTSTPIGYAPIRGQEVSTDESDWNNHSVEAPSQEWF